MTHSFCPIISYWSAVEHFASLQIISSLVCGQCEWVEESSGGRPPLSVVVTSTSFALIVKECLGGLNNNNNNNDAYFLYADFLLLVFSRFCANVCEENPKEAGNVLMLDFSAALCVICRKLLARSTSPQNICEISFCQLFFLFYALLLFCKDHSGVVVVIFCQWKLHSEYLQQRRRRVEVDFSCFYCPTADQQDQAVSSSLTSGFLCFHVLRV